MIERLILVPLVSVGPFQLGHPPPLELLSKGKQWESDPECWDMDDVLPGCQVYVEDGVVSSVDCYEQCSLHGYELLGSDEAALAEAFGAQPTSREWQDVVDERQEILYFDDASVMAWMANGKCVTVQCSRFIEDE